MTAIHLVSEIPGPNSRTLITRREKATVSGMALLTPVVIDQAEGAVVTDVDGNTLLDFAGGIGALATGHCPERVVAAIRNQTGKLIHTCALVASYEPFIEVVELLNRLATGKGPKRSALLNSGAEAVEAAVKIARCHTGRPAIVVFEGAYHGRTNLTLAMTSKYARFKKGFGPFAPEIYRLPFPNLYRRPPEMSEEGYLDFCLQQLDHAMVAQVDPSDVAAMVIEPVQGEGGYIPTPPTFLRHIRKLCDTHGMLMIADEIQCGFGRTGKLFAMEHYGIVPDLIVTGKSIAAGMPLAAVTGPEEIMTSPNPGGIGGTYSGNPLACVAAVENIRMISDPAFLQHARSVGEHIRKRLLRLQQEMPLIGDVRGLGAMLAMELVKDPVRKTPAVEEVNRFRQEALQRGLITLPAGLYFNCVRFLPPLTITQAQLDEGLDVVEAALKAVTRTTTGG